jgi:uncharacterized membrane protein YvlD (DUF360 family)
MRASPTKNQSAQLRSDVRRFARIILGWLATALVLRVFGAVLPGVHVDSWNAALLGGAAIGVLNWLIWPLFIRLMLPVTVLSLGTASLVINGAVIWLSSHLVGGMEVAGLLDGMLLALVMAAVNTAMIGLLSMDDVEVYLHHARVAAKRYGVTASEVPGVLFLEIDGLAYDVLQRALRNGDAPVLRTWLASSHRMARWETDWSSQTGACQAGLLHGSNTNIPGFRWWDRSRGRAVITNHPKDAHFIERDHSDRRGLLAFDGASRCNIMSGDAPHSLLTMSKVLGPASGQPVGREYFAFFASPYNFTRTLMLAIKDVAVEMWYARQQRQAHVRPRVERRFPYPLVRAYATAVQRDIQVQVLIGDLLAGRPVMYTTFLGYDEVAHHSGIERRDTLAVLGGIDRQFARIAAAARKAPRPYRLVVLSDHGQSQGTTFKQRTGASLEELVHDLCGKPRPESVSHGSEALWSLYGLLTELTAGSSLVARGLRALSGKHRVDGAIVLGKESREMVRKHRRTRAHEPVPELVVLASGCLGLVYFPRHAARLTLEEINVLYPNLISGLRDQAGIGFLLVRSSTHGALAIGAKGTRHLDSDRVDGEDPLARYGPNAARHLMRTDAFENVADIMVNAAYDPASDEVPAFEELVGSHGGMGGTQAYPFVMFPQEWAAPLEPIVGAEEMHRWMRRWLADLGHDQFAKPGRDEIDAVKQPERQPAPVLAEAGARGQDPRST